jgi:hypothetical protein
MGGIKKYLLVPYKNLKARAIDPAVKERKPPHQPKSQPPPREPSPEISDEEWAKQREKARWRVRCRVALNRRNGDPEKLEAMQAALPPGLRRGQFKAPWSCRLSPKTKVS